MIESVEREMAQGADASAPSSVPGSGVPRDWERVTELREALVAEEISWRIFKFQQARKTFEFHHWTTVLTFILVHVIVAVGLLLTWLQFRRAEFQSAAEPHELSISREGFRIRSPVIGLIVLVVSLGFYYLYLTNVYPVSYVESVQPKAQSK